MDVMAERIEGFGVANLRFIERWRPDWELASEPMREVALDELHGFFKRDIRRWSKDRVDVVRHQDEGVEMKAVFGALFEEYIEKELGVGLDMEETAAICCCRRDEVGAEVLRGPVHVGMIAAGRG